MVGRSFLKKNLGSGMGQEKAIIKWLPGKEKTELGEKI